MWLFFATFISGFFSQQVVHFKNNSVELVTYPPGPGVLSEADLQNYNYFNVYIGEYVMQQWRGKSIWNLYHAGLVFEPTNDPKHVFNRSSDPETMYIVDYNALEDRDILPFIIPSSFFPTSFFRSTSITELISEVVSYYYSSNALSLQWQNAGQLRLMNKRPDEYTNFTYVGKISREMFVDFRVWVAKNWTQAADTFEVFTVVDPDWTRFFIKARICHELVEDGLAKLLEMNMSLGTLSRPVFRDTVIFYATDVQPVDLSNGREIRDLLRFFRILATNWDSFSSSFQKARELAGKLSSLGLPGVVFSRGKLHWMRFAGGFLDYCYIERNITARDRSPKRLCLTAGTPVEVTWGMTDWLMLLEIKIDDFFIYIFTALLSFVIFKFFFPFSILVCYLGQGHRLGPPRSTDTVGVRG